MVIHTFITTLQDHCDSLYVAVRLSGFLFVKRQHVADPFFGASFLLESVSLMT